MLHRKRLRISGFDYSTAGLYLVTVCTHDRRCVFGRVEDDVVVPSDAGEIVSQQIKGLPARLADVGLDAFVVMPNHVHAIVALESGARQASPLRIALGTVVGAFKSGSAREINRLRGTPGGNVWQSGYQDHVVRDERDLQRIREYVEANPIRWALDPENPARYT